MKNTKLILTCLAILMTLQTQAQLNKLKKNLGSDEPVLVENLNANEVWQIVEQALRESENKLGEIKLEENIIYTDFFEWTSLAIKKRARIGFTYKEPNLEILVMNRQYASTEGWSDAMGKLAKATKKEYMDDMGALIEQISNDPEQVKKAVLNSVLFPVFNPLHQLDNFKWLLVKVFRTEKGEVIFEFKVTNKGSKLTNLDVSEIGLYTATAGKSPTGRANIKWEKYVDISRRTQLKPGETIIMQATVSNIYHWDREDVPLMRIKAIYNDGTEATKFFNIYNIPIPYTHTEDK